MIEAPLYILGPGLGRRVLGSGFRVQGSAIVAHNLRCRIQCLGVMRESGPS